LKTKVYQYVVDFDILANSNSEVTPLERHGQCMLGYQVKNAEPEGKDTSTDHGKLLFSFRVIKLEKITLDAYCQIASVHNQI